MSSVSLVPDVILTHIHCYLWPDESASHARVS